MIHLEGVYTALVTPFDGGQVDYAALRRIVDQQVAGGVAGIVPVGTTGESPTLTCEEHLKVIETVIEQAEAASVTYPGFIRDFRELGADFTVME